MSSAPQEWWICDRPHSGHRGRSTCRHSAWTSPVGAPGVAFIHAIEYSAYESLATENAEAWIRIYDTERERDSLRELLTAANRALVNTYILVRALEQHFCESGSPCDWCKALEEWEGMGGFNE
jgi:hypothetical protein